MSAVVSAIIALWSKGELAGSVLAGGIVGNLLASALYDGGKWVRGRLADRAPDVAALIDAREDPYDPDLLRTLRRAECAVLVSLCDQALREDHGLRTGKGPLVERLRSRLHERRDPEVAVLCRIRRAFARSYEALEAMPVAELVALHGTALTDIPALTRAASECFECPTQEAMRALVVGREVEALDRAVRKRAGAADASGPLAPDGLPAALRARLEAVEGGWWDLLRVAFREELKKPGNEKAWRAWQLDVLSLVPQIAAGGVEQFEATLDRLDEKLNAVWTDLGRLRAEWRAAIEEVTPLLDEILLEVRAGREDVRAVGEAVASVHAEVRSVKDRVEALDALRGPPGDPVPFELPRRALAQELFGRADLLARLVERLARREHTGVWGPAGFGKTALAAEALHRILGDDRASLATTPYPDGVVLLDLYRLRGDPEQAWIHLADAFAPGLAGHAPEARARLACRGRRALVVVEGAEEAGGDLAWMLAVLAPETTRLVLTRNLAQVPGPGVLRIDEALAQEDAQALLRRLAGEGVPQHVLATVADRLGGHPLALTWAGSQLGLGEEPPEHFADALAAAGLPRVAEPGYEAHTLEWLYRRSVDHLTPDARCVLAAAGWVAAAPFPLGLAAAGLGVAGDAAIEARAAAALKLLVRHGLLRWLDPFEGHWEFTHVLAHQFAREADSADPASLARFGEWAIRYVDEGFRGSQLGGDCTALERALRHAVALVGLKDSESVLGILMYVLQYDVADRLFAFGRVDLAKAPLMAVRNRLSDIAPLDVALQRELSVSSNRIGDVQVAQGQLGEALASYRAGLEIARRLAEADPANAAWHRDLSISYERIGDVQVAQGQLADALASYQAGLEIARRLAQADPANAEWRRDLSISNNKIGDVQVAQGRLGEALASYRVGLEISRRLAQADPANAAWQRDLNVSNGKIGDVQVVQGRLVEALASYRAGLEISRRLAQADPANAAWQRDLSISYERIGDVQVAQGWLGEALASYRESEQIRRRLTQADPANAAWQRDLTVSNLKIGDMEAAQGRLVEALASYRAGLEIARRLAQADPANAAWQRDLSVSNNKVGDVQVAQGQLVEALASYRAGLEIARRLAQADPANAAWQRDLSVSNEKIGDVQVAQGWLGEALASYRESERIRRRLVQADPANAEWQRDLSISNNKIGNVQVAQGRLVEALASYRAGLEIARRLAQADRANAAWQRDLTVSNVKIGDVQVAQGQLVEALASYRAGLEIARRLAQADPANAAWQRDLSLSLTKIADALSRDGRRAEALPYAEESLALGERLAALDPSNAIWQRDVAVSRALVARLTA